MPDDAALSLFYARLRRLHAEILVMPTDFLRPRIENDEVVQDFKHSLLAAELVQFPEQRVVVFGVVDLLPAKPMFLRCLYHAVAQSFGLVARHDELHRREKGMDKFPSLVVEVLANALGNRHRGTL